MTHNDARSAGKPDHGVAIASHSPHEFVPPQIAPDDPASVAIQIALSSGFHRLQAHEPGARQGDVEGIHRMRTAARRLRSELRCYEDLLDEDWAEALREELKWLGRKLGEVRDLDVMTERLLHDAGDQAAMLEPLIQALRARHAAASQALHSALDGDLYQGLMARLAEAADRSALNEDAHEPCRAALPPLVKDAWRRVKKCGRALRPTDPDEDFHEVRKRAKRARYAAESVAIALGPDAAEDAKRFARRATDVQDVLGEHQDAIVAAREIEQAAARHPHDGPFNLAAGRLLERQVQAAQAARAKFFEVWDAFDRKELRRWLKV
jgi:CHAD domain-containing protein